VGSWLSARPAPKRERAIALVGEQLTVETQFGNLRKHGVSFEEVQTAFDDELGAYYPDTLHERRFILIGYSKGRRLLYVVHAEVGASSIRIISARKATRHEKARYEND
jgi:uncharacterized DUF497 family protein